MEVIDKILNEWSFRCHDGIVDINDPKKVAILNEIIGFDLDEARADMENTWKKYFADTKVKTTVKKDADIYDANGKKTGDKIRKGEQVTTQIISNYQPKIPVEYNGNIVDILISTLNTDLEPAQNDTIDYCLWVLRNEANLKPDILELVKDTFDKSSSNRKKDFLENFRKEKDITNDSLNRIYNNFKEYVVIKPNKTVGRGEIAVLLGVAKSKSGGSAEKDILLGDKVYEVKELSGDEFRTGSGGYITNSSFQKNYNYLMELLSKKVKDTEEKSKSEIEEQIKILVRYFEKEYKTGNISDRVLKSIKNLISTKENNLSKINQFLADEDVDADTNYVKIGNKKYKVDSQETDESGNLISIKLKGEVSEEKATTIKLKKHPWVQNPDTLTEDFEKIWDTYLTSITGFIVYNGNTLELYSSNDIKNKFKPFRVVQNQINIIRK